MAKYTELLSEYLEHGGELPAVFETIEGFNDLFIGNFCDCEIGFETPVLFAIKLETRANIIIPAYAKRISEFKAAEEALLNPSKKRIKTGELLRDYAQKATTNTNTKTGEKSNTGTDTHTYNTADHERTEAELPFNGANQEEAITQRNIDKAYKDIDTLEKTNTETFKNYQDRTETIEDPRTDKEKYNEITDTESGYTATEAQALFKSLEDKIYLIMQACLSEFDNLFMKVY